MNASNQFIARPVSVKVPVSLLGNSAEAADEQLNGAVATMCVRPVAYHQDVPLTGPKSEAEFNAGLQVQPAVGYGRPNDISSARAS